MTAGGAPAGGEAGGIGGQQEQMRRWRRAGRGKGRGGGGWRDRSTAQEETCGWSCTSGVCVVTTVGTDHSVRAAVLRRRGRAAAGDASNGCDGAVGHLSTNPIVRIVGVALLLLRRIDTNDGHSHSSRGRVGVGGADAAVVARRGVGAVAGQKWGRRATAAADNRLLRVGSAEG